METLWARCGHSIFFSYILLVDGPRTGLGALRAFSFFSSQSVLVEYRTLIVSCLSCWDKKEEGEWCLAPYEGLQWNNWPRDFRHIAKFKIGKDKIDTIAMMLIFSNDWQEGTELALVIILRQGETVLKPRRVDLDAPCAKASMEFAILFNSMARLSYESTRLTSRDGRHCLLLLHRLGWVTFKKRRLGKHFCARVCAKGKTTTYREHSGGECRTVPSTPFFLLSIGFRSYFLSIFIIKLYKFSNYIYFLFDWIII